MKKFKLGNKGISIESAILFMLVIFMFCSLITSYTVYRSYQVKIDKLQIESKIELDNIGEQFVLLKSGKITQANLGNYRYLESMNNGIITCSIFNNNNYNKELLYIELKIDNKNNVQILKWCYKDTN